MEALSGVRGQGPCPRCFSELAPGDTTTRSGLRDLLRVLRKPRQAIASNHSDPARCGRAKRLQAQR